MKKTNKKLMMGLAITMAVLVVFTATFAWFTAKDMEVNKFRAKTITDDSVQIVEIFPDPDPKPGVKMTKQVGAVNNGDTNVFVRISFEEVLQILDKNGVQKSSASATLPAADFPVESDPTKYSASPWTDMTSTNPAGYTVTGKPTGNVQTWYKTETIGGKEVLTFFMYNKVTAAHGTEFPSGYNQKVTFDVNYDTTTKTINFANVLYWSYENGYKPTIYKDWADKNEDPRVLAASTPITIPTAGPATIGADPAAMKILSDPNQKIYAIFNSANYSATPAAGKWTYNTVDGYFYYGSKLLPTQSTAWLLDSLLIDATGGIEYSKMKLDFIVTMNAIQTTDAALTATDGWKLGNTDPVYTYLKTLCDN